MYALSLTHTLNLSLSLEHFINCYTSQGFDNTESIIFNDSASLTDEMQDPTQPALDYRYNRNSPRPAGYREPLSLFENLEGPGIGPGWQAEVDEERARRGLNPAYDPRFNHNIYQTASVQDDENDESIHDGDLEEGTSIVQNTPSRTRVVVKEDIGTRHGQQKPKRSLRADDLRNQSVVPRHQKSSSDVAVRIAVEPPLRQRHDRFHIYKPHDADAEPKIPFEPQHHIHAPPTQVRPSAFSSKVSSLHESSSEEEVSTQPEAANSPQLGEKRPHSTQELDFDSPDLQSKSIADLDEVPFSLDPRLPPTKLALDSNGTPLNLSAKLTNLTKMRLDDQTALFRSLTDTEREDTADWFLEKFRADMAKLMAVRTERRKVALKFEMDVKMRERRVHTKREDVEQQLVGLKKGGAELVKAQSPAKGL